MTWTAQQKQAMALGALGLGAVLATRAAWRRERYDFRGRSVVITGGSRGLGLVLARELAAEGARLTLIARDGAELDRAAGNVREGRPRAEVATLVADVRRRDDAERAVAEVVGQCGRLDVLINNAGIIQVGPIDHMQLSDYADAMNTHFWGPLYMMLAALPHLRRLGGGRIVNISSIGGRIAVPHLVPYSASKFALSGLSEGLRAELRPDNILVTTVYPGLMRTGSPMNATFKGKWPQEYAWFAISDSLPLASINATRAARQIVAATRRGDAELVISVQAKLAVLARQAAPELFAETLALINRLLPDPSTLSGDQPRRGRESTSRWAPSMLTALSDRAAERNNET